MALFSIYFSLLPEGNQIMRNILVPAHICEKFIRDFCIYFPKRKGINLIWITLFIKCYIQSIQKSIQVLWITLVDLTSGLKVIYGRTKIPCMPGVVDWKSLNLFIVNKLMISCTFNSRYKSKTSWKATSLFSPHLPYCYTLQPKDTVRSVCSKPYWVIWLFSLEFAALSLSC